MIKAKVTELYDLYYEGKISLFARDQYLLTKKPLNDRLAGDNDSLMCWLRLLEVAMKAYEASHVKTQKHAEKFFQPFRALGRKRLLESRAATLSQRGAAVHEDGRENSVTSPHHRQREETQFLELSQSTRISLQERQQLQPLEGLSETIMSEEMETNGARLKEPATADDDSIVSPGPFGRIPLIDQDFTSDSSYNWSRGRDVALSYDTLTASSATTATPEGYRAERRQALESKIDQLIGNLSRLNQTDDITTSGTVTSQSEKFELDWERGVARESDLSTSETSQNGHNPSSSQSQDTFSFQQKLRFPIHLIADTSSIKEALIVPQLVNSNSSLGTDTTNATGRSGPVLHTSQFARDTNRIYIEEIARETSQESIDDPLRPDNFLQLAQDSPLSSQDTVTIEHEESIVEFREWISGQQEFTPPSTDSGGWSADIHANTSSSSSSSRQILEILSSPETQHSSDHSSGVSSHAVWRSIPLQPPQGLPGDTSSESESAPSLATGTDNDIIDWELESEDEMDVEARRQVFQGNLAYDQRVRILAAPNELGPHGSEESNREGEWRNDLPLLTRRQLQGTAISPTAYSTMWHVAADLAANLSDIDTHSEDEDSSSLDSEESQQVYVEEDSIQASSHEIEELIDGDSRRSSSFPLEGDTVASTCSYLSHLDIASVQSYPARQQGAYQVEIPVRELDDPPDGGYRDAASHDGENEH